VTRKDTRMGTEATGLDTAKMTDEQRDEAASKLVDRFSLWSGAAGLVPIPIVDIAAVGGVQLQMLRRLSEIYGVPFSDNLGKSVIASLAGSVLPASAATTTAMGVGSVMKGLPGVGTVIGALTMPVVSAGATYLIGKVFIQHFASGGTLLDFNAPDYREFIKAQKAKLSARSATATAADQSVSAVRAPTPYPFFRRRCGPVGPRQRSRAETWRNDGGCSDRLCRILPSHRAVRDPTPPGLLGHIHNIPFHHARGNAAGAAADRSDRTRRITTPPAEQLSVAAAEAVVFRMPCGRRPVRRERTSVR